MLTIMAPIHAKPGRSDELGATLLALVSKARAEAGNIRYDVHRSNDDPDLWLMFEYWKSQTDLDRHFEQPYMKEAVKKFSDLVEGELKLETFTRVSTD